MSETLDVVGEERRIEEVYFGNLKCATCQYSTILPPSIVIPKEVSFCKHYQKLCSGVQNCGHHLEFGKEEY